MNEFLMIDNIFSVVPHKVTHINVYTLLARYCKNMHVGKYLTTTAFEQVGVLIVPICQIMKTRIHTMTF